MNQHARTSAAGGTHAHPSYMAIFWWLLALTIVEVGVGVMSVDAGAAHILKVSALVLLALVKAALVAMYFMHLRFEKRTLALIAGTPLVLCVLLMLLLLPDSSRRNSFATPVDATQGGAEAGAAAPGADGHGAPAAEATAPADAPPPH
jgi:caa(3)-type oxidase subunit IV